MSPRLRDRIKSESYFQAAIDAELSSIERYQSLSAGDELPVVTRSLYKLAAKQVRIALHRYSRGDPVDGLHRHFEPMLDAWEAAERSAAHLWSAAAQRERHDWAANLDFYIISFWLVGLALAFEVDDAQWTRLLALIGNDGNDRLLDRVIATRSPRRAIGCELLHPRPYQRLMSCIDSPTAGRPALLAAFVERWYVELGRRNASVGELRDSGDACAPAPRLHTADPSSDAPYWHGHHTLDGGYFGYWCLEAVAVAKAFGIDDTECLGHRHYPGDLLRKDVPSRSASTPDAGVDAAPDDDSPRRPGRLARWFRRR